MLSLVLFHRVLIAFGIVFCLMFATFEIAAYAREGGIARLALGIVFGVLTVGLAWYLRHLNRILKLPPDQK